MTEIGGSRTVMGVVFALVLIAPLHSGAQSTETWPPPQSRSAALLTGEPIPLDIGVVIFDAGVKPYDAANPRHVLREVEGRLLAVALKRTLERSNVWGAVRVLPAPSRLTSVTITGEILWSDGQDLVVRLSATDASERRWFERLFRARAPGAAPAESLGQGGEETTLVGIESDAYAPLFVGVANTLREVALELNERAVERLLTTASMRYAAELAPTAFGDYLRVSETGVEVLRLPSRDDPMLARIERIRNQEAQFVDTADEQYVDLEQALLPTYRLWQQSSREQRQYLGEYTDRASQRETTGSRGSFAVLQQQYATYRSVRIQEQDVYDLATGFDNETEATVMRFGDRVVTLSGSLEQQYGQWRALLAEIFRIEQGLTP